MTSCCPGGNRPAARRRRPPPPATPPHQRRRVPGSWDERGGAPSRQNGGVASELAWQPLVVRTVAGRRCDPPAARRRCPPPPAMPPHQRRRVPGSWDERGGVPNRQNGGGASELVGRPLVVRTAAGRCLGRPGARRRRRGRTDHGGACCDRATSVDAACRQGEATATLQNTQLLLGLWRQRDGPTHDVRRHGGVRTRGRGRDGVRGPRRGDRGAGRAAGQHPLLLVGGHGDGLCRFNLKRAFRFAGKKTRAFSNKNIIYWRSKTDPRMTARKKIRGALLRLSYQQIKK